MFQSSSLSLSSLFSTLRSAISGQAALHHVAAICQYHRIQASPGYRAAAGYVAEQLEAAGLSVRLLSYPATDSACYWTMAGWQEWDCGEATLHLLHDDEPPELLCDYRSLPTSLIQRSVSFDGEVKVVLLEDGTRPEHYSAVDVRGKLVLSDGDPDQVYDLAVAQRGALGILCDRMEPKAPGRSKLDLPDFRRYTSFWWVAGQRKCFGFVLTPRQGEKLRKLLKGRPSASSSLRVRAHVVSRFYDGAMEVVEARFPGETDQEVIIIAHLCHPRPSAHDNASGCAAALEAASGLRRLIDQGALAAPQRGLRFLWVPEMSGTYAYLSEHEAELPNWIAGLNLDMVGADQRQIDCIFMLERPPEALASFAPDLLERLREELFDDVTDLASNRRYPLFRHAVTSFTGGSDHFILSDPTVGVPTPMLIQWPDRYWHTSADTVDKVDPKMLARSAVLTAAYAHWLATAGNEQALWLGQEMSTRFEARLARQAQEAMGKGLSAETPVALAQVWTDFQRQARFWHDRHLAALSTLPRLSSGMDVLLEELSEYADQALARQKDRAKAALMRKLAISDVEELSHLSSAEPQPWLPPRQAWQTQAARLVPRRLYRGPASLRAHLARLSAEDRLAWYRLAERAGEGWRTAYRLAEYWADGERTLAEIADLVELECGQPRPKRGQQRGAELLECFRFLEKMGLMELKEAEDATA